MRQAVNGSTVSVAPGMYRGLASQMWNALQATGHGHDTILIGEFAPFGLSGRAGPGHPQGLPGNFGQTKPLQFLRTLYCVDSNYRELRGRAARAVGCPLTAAGSRSFRWPSLRRSLRGKNDADKRDRYAHGVEQERYCQRSVGRKCDSESRKCDCKEHCSRERSLR